MLYLIYLLQTVGFSRQGNLIHILLTIILLFYIAMIYEAPILVLSMKTCTFMRKKKTNLLRYLLCKDSHVFTLSTVPVVLHVTSCAGVCGAHGWYAWMSLFLLVFTACFASVLWYVLEICLLFVFILYFVVYTFVSSDWLFTNTKNNNNNNNNSS